MNIRIGILGGAGYTGRKLLKYCKNHPYIKSVEIFGNTTSGSSIYDVFPEYVKEEDNFIIKSINELKYEEDAYFLALPHGESLKYVPEIIKKGKKAIDLGGDYRLDDPALYEEWYNYSHTSAALLKKKIYGLADYDRDCYKNVNLIANPGCYPTAALLSILPIVKLYGKEIANASVCAYSGTSGAGKSPKPHLLMSEMYGNAKAYNVNQHRHEPEILQRLIKEGFSGKFAFTTHLLPVDVGIYSTATIFLTCEVSQSKLDLAYAEKYENSKFVRLRNQPPDLKWTVNNNYCDINISAKGNKIIATSAIDNLIKGASGQAMQNFNIMFGFSEELGIM